MSIAEKVRAGVAKRVQKRATPEFKVNTADYPAAPEPVGTKVRILKGEVTNDALQGVRSAVGREARLDGAPYVSKAGPNKGKVIQPVRVEGTGEVLGVPTDYLERRTSSKSRGNFAPGANVTQEEWDRIFGKKKRR